jgi:hypothetical protein
MLKYATRLPPGKPVELLDDNLIRKTGSWIEKDMFLFQKRVINHFIKHPDPLVVPVYQFTELGRDRHKQYTYSYIMERCGILNVDERAFVDYVGDLWDKHCDRACAQPDPALLSYQKKFPALFDFLKTVVEQNRYMDLHSGNVMMSQDGYCLVDLEGFMKWPLNSASHNWISEE